MPSIDYSKWDNLDTGSEGENVAPPAPPVAPKQSKPNNSKVPAGIGSKIVLVRCTLDKMGDLILDSLHPIFQEDAVTNSVFALIGMPLLFYRMNTESSGGFNDLDNQIVTYFNIDPVSGIAPPEWQSGVGSVIVAREDRLPLYPQHVEGMWMFCDYILECFGETGEAPRHLYTRKAFERWFRGYVLDCQGYRTGKGWYDDPEDWREVKSPFAYLY